MLVKTHINTTIPVAAIIATVYSLPLENAILFFAFSVLGVVLPDIDEPNSYIGRKLPVFSILLSMFIRHRGITHFLIAPLLIFACATLFDGVVKLSIFAVAVGWLVHILGDMMTNGGVRGFLFPLFSGRAVLLPYMFRFETGSITELIILLCLTIANMFLISQFFLSQQIVQVVVNAIRV